MARKSRLKPRWVRELALKRIKKLLELAEREEKQARKNRYADLARKTAQKYKVRLPKAYKRRICRKCGALLIPGKTLTVRVSSRTKTVIYVCKKCGNVRRYGYSREKGQKINKDKNT